MLTASTSRTEETKAETFSCDSVLQKCIVYIKTLEDERGLLRKQIVEADRREAELRNEARSYPWYYWAVLGVAIGYSVGLTVKGGQ